jgi:hypothetical protein
MDRADIEVHLFNVLRPYMISFLVGMGAIFLVLLWAWKDKIFAFLFPRKKRIPDPWGERRRSEDSLLAEVFGRQEVLMNRLMDVIERNTEALTAMKESLGDVKEQFKVCRDNCDTLHKRIDEHVFRGGHAASA